MAGYRPPTAPRGWQESAKSRVQHISLTELAALASVKKHALAAWPHGAISHFRSSPCASTVVMKFGTGNRQNDEEQLEGPEGGSWISSPTFSLCADCRAIKNGLKCLMKRPTNSARTLTMVLMIYGLYTKSKPRKMTKP